MKVGFINYLFLNYSDCHEEPHHEEPVHEEPPHEEPHHEEPHPEEPHHEEPHHEGITSIRASNVVTPKGHHPRPNSASVPTSSQNWYAYFEMPVIRQY